MGSVEVTTAIISVLVPLPPTSIPVWHYLSQRRNRRRGASVPPRHRIGADCELCTALSLPASENTGALIALPHYPHPNPGPVPSNSPGATILIGVRIESGGLRQTGGDVANDKGAQPGVTSEGTEAGWTWEYGGRVGFTLNHDGTRNRNTKT